MVSFPTVTASVQFPLASAASQIAAVVNPGYLDGRAETSARAALDKPLTTNPPPPATATDKLEQDVIQLSRQSDQVLQTYGSDAKLTNTTKALTNTVDAARLARVGSGRDSELAAPTSTTSHATQANGSVRDTTVDLLSKSVDQTKASAANGNIGSVRTFSERVVTQSGGNALSGSPLATTRRDEATLETVTADAAKRTQTTTTLQTAVITSSDNSNIRVEQLERTVIYRLRDDGNFEQTVRERFFSVTTDASGVNVISANLRDTSSRNLVDGRTGRLDTSAETNTAAVTQAANGTVTATTSRNAVNSSLVATVGANGQKSVSASTVSQLVQNSTARIDAAGNASVSTSERSARYTGDGENTLTATQAIATQSITQRANGSIAASAREIDSSVTYVNDGVDGNGRDVLTIGSLSARDRTVSANIAANGTVSAKGTDVAISASTKQAALTPVKTTTAPTAAATITADGAVRAGATRTGTSVSNGPAVILPAPGSNSGEILVRATDSVGHGPVIHIDPIAQFLAAQARDGAGFVNGKRSDDAEDRNISGSIKTNSRQLSSISGNTILALAKDATDRTTNPIALGSNQGSGIYRVFNQNGGRVNNPVTSLLADATA